MAVTLRNSGLEYSDDSLQTDKFEPPLWGGYTNSSNVFSTYRNFATGTKVAHMEERGTNSGFNGNGSRTLNERYRRVWRKTGANSWTEVGG